MLLKRTVPSFETSKKKTIFLSLFLVTCNNTMIIIFMVGVGNYFDFKS